MSAWEEFLKFSSYLLRTRRKVASSAFWIGLITSLIGGILLNQMMIMNSHDADNQKLEDQISTLVERADLLQESGEYNESIKFCEDALKQEPGMKSRAPIGYGRLYQTMGNAYRSLSSIRDTELNLLKSMFYYEEALDAFSGHGQKATSIEHANCESDLGKTYMYLAEVREKEANLDLAIDHFQHALFAIDPKRHPLEHAFVQNNLGSAYQLLSEVRNKEQNLNRSIQAYGDALKICTQEEYPEDFANIQYNLGSAYQILSGTP